MNRISTTWSGLKSRGEKALITYITAGDPDLAATLAIMHSLAAAGTDIIELGFPFSEPMADGPVIQKAIERSLNAGTKLNDVIALVAEFRKSNNTTPIVLMGYLNPVYKLGYENFAAQSAAAGVDGVLIVDGPPAYVGALTAALKAHHLAPVFLLTQTTALERVPEIAAAGAGFLYYVAFNGVTGLEKLNTEEVAARVRAITPLISLPLAVGFGIKTAAAAAAVSRLADGVVIGSSLVDIISTAPLNFYPQLSSFTAALKAATRAAVKL